MVSLGKQVTWNGNGNQNRPSTPFNSVRSLVKNYANEQFTVSK